MKTLTHIGFGNMVNSDKTIAQRAETLTGEEE